MDSVVYTDKDTGEFNTPGWMGSVLRAAALYNAVWGASIILFPNALFDLTGMERPLYPQIWQCVGMVVGVYGVAYGMASLNPSRHWPVVLAGLLGKVFGPIGFAVELAQGVFPAVWGLTIVANDLIWWVPFFLIIRHAYLSHITEDLTDILPLSTALDGAVTQDGHTVSALSERSPVLLVFLRHFGCTFCRESLGDLVRKQEQFAANGRLVVLVHMSSEQEAVSFFSKAGVDDFYRVSDPDRLLYRAAGLSRGSLSQLFGLSVWFRGIRAGILDGYGIGLPAADPFLNSHKPLL